MHKSAHNTFVNFRRGAIFAAPRFLRRATLAAAVLAIVLLMLAALVACSSSTAHPSPIAECTSSVGCTPASPPGVVNVSGEGGLEGGLIDGGPQVTGQVIDFATKVPLQGATIASDFGTRTLSVADGKYSLPVLADTPFAAAVTAPSYVKLREQEVQVGLTPAYRGQSPLFSQGTFDALRGNLSPAPDTSKGIVAVLVVPTGGCATEDGTSITISPAGSSKIRYVRGAGPSPTESNVARGNMPSAIAYDVDPQQAFSLQITGGTCRQKGYPYTEGGITYTGKASVESGNAVTFVRISLE